MSHKNKDILEEMLDYDFKVEQPDEYMMRPRKKTSLMIGRKILAGRRNCASCVTKLFLKEI